MQPEPAVSKESRGAINSINVFAGGAEEAQQLPMIFALMTQRTTNDYVNLFEGLKRAFEEEGLPCHPGTLQLPFEAGPEPTGPGPGARSKCRAPLHPYKIIATS